MPEVQGKKVWDGWERRAQPRNQPPPKEPRSRLKPRKWLVRRLWLAYHGEGAHRVRATVRDGHVLYPCGCMWNLEGKSYTVRCTRDDHRDVTPPHEDACSPMQKKTSHQVVVQVPDQEILTPEIQRPLNPSSSPQPPVAQPPTSTGGRHRTPNP